MKEFKATTTINAAPEKIWEILLNTPAYPEWDPYCDKIEGRVVLGGKIKAFTKLAPRAPVSGEGDGACPASEDDLVERDALWAL